MVAKFLGEVFGAAENFRPGMRGGRRPDNALLEVDQDQRGGFRVECDHRGLEEIISDVRKCS